MPIGNAWWLPQGSAAYDDEMERQLEAERRNATIQEQQRQSIAYNNMQPGPAAQAQAAAHASLAAYQQRQTAYQEDLRDRNDKINSANADRQTRANLEGAQLAEQQRGSNARLWEEEQNRREHARQYDISTGRQLYEFNSRRQDEADAAHANRQFTAERDIYDTQGRQYEAALQRQHQDQYQQAGFDNQSYQAQQHAQLQSWVHEQELSQTDKLHLQRMQNSVSRVQQDLQAGTIDQQTANDAIFQLRTGIDPLVARQKKAQMKQQAEQHEALVTEHQARSQLLAQEAAQHATMNDHNARMHAMSAAERYVVLPDGSRVFTSVDGKETFHPPEKAGGKDTTVQDLAKQDETIRREREARVKDYHDVHKLLTTKDKDNKPVYPTHAAVEEYMRERDRRLGTMRGEAELQPGERLEDGVKVSAPGGPGAGSGESPPVAPPATNAPSSFIQDRTGKWVPATRIEPGQGNAPEGSPSAKPAQAEMSAIENNPAYKGKLSNAPPEVQQRYKMLKAQLAGG